MENIAPSFLAEKWDNVGLQIGGYDKEIKRIMVCLEVTNEIIDEAISKNVDLIICHHPLIFKPLKAIQIDDVIGKMVFRLIQNNIDLYCAHTNLDIAQGGTNDVLAKILNLTDIKPLVSIEQDIIPLNNPINRYGLGRVGKLKESMTLAAFCKDIKPKLDLKHVKITGYEEKIVGKVGLCTGSGAEFIYDAYKAGCDCYITGDVKYHDAQYANELGLSVMDAGHFETENIIGVSLYENLNKFIKERNYDVEVILTTTDINPFQIL